MAQRTWIPRVAGRTEAPDDGGRLVAAPAPPTDPGRAAARLARVAAQAGPGWLWPHWLERQLDPRSAAFIPGGDLAFRYNLTGHHWTAIGNLDSPHHATVDPRGLVTPWPGRWSLDWWVGADDRWHLPAREAGARQRLVGAAPVVETALRIPSGDALHRAYAIRRSSAEGGGELVVVEVENRSKLPVALALAVRPYGPAGLAPVGRVELDDAGTTVLVDGEVAMLLPRAAARFAASVAADGDSAATVLGGDASERWTGAARCPEGLAQAAFVFPLAHSATLRVVLPAVPERPGRRAGAAVAFPTAVASADQVAAGWQSQAGRGMRLELPDARLAEAVDANRRFLLLRPDAGPEVVGALDAYGYHDEAATVLAGYPARQRADGAFGERDQPGATGAALWALGRHWELARRPVPDDVVEALARGAQWVERARRGSGLRPRGARRDVPVPQGLLPAGRVPARSGAEVSFADDAWAVAGLRAAAAALAGSGQAPAAAQVAREADGLWADLERSWAEAAARLAPSGGPAAAAVPAGPRRAVDAGAAAVLVACTLGLVDAADPHIAATAEALRTGHVIAEGEAVHDRSGLSPAATLALAGVELRAADDRALVRLAWLVGAATDTWAWPTAIHPRLGGGSGGDGHDPAVTAAFLVFVRDLLVREVPGGLVLSSLVPGSWLGQGWEVHDAPTAQGNLSYAVRWHGDRPALLWDLEAHEGTGSVRLTAPGLDPAWSTTDRRGEALLAPVAVPEGPATDEAASPGAVAGPTAPVEAGTPISLSFRPPASPRPPSGPDEPGSLS